MGLKPLHAASLILAAVIAGCGSSGTSSSAAAAASLAPSASAPAASSVPASPDCQSQLISWRDNGGSDQLKAVATDLGTVQSAVLAFVKDASAGADTSSDQSTLQADAASLQSDSQTAQTNLPPACVPNLRADYSAALNDAAKSAIDCENAVSELGSGSDSVAVGDIQAANAAITSSGDKFSAANSDLTTFSNANG
jgi:hypothetical protein